MKLKYYLRGLGIGIIVSVVVVSVAVGKQKPMSDAEVKARAKELGMIENTVLSEVAGKKEEKSTEEETVKEDLLDEPSEEDLIEDKVEEGKVEKDKIEETSKNEVSDSQEMISITIEKGDSSWSVSQKMELAGLIDSAKEFDTFLCQNGYDKRICVGTYDISKSTTNEEKAKIITKSK